MNSGGVAGYDPRSFPPIAVTVDVVLFAIRDEALHVLLIKRGGEPYLGCWALPGGFVQPEDPDLKHAAERELEEETDVRRWEVYLEQLGSYGAEGRDPRMRVVTVAYWAACSRPPRPMRGGDAAWAEFMPVSEIESGGLDLAFDHGKIVADALARLRAKLEYTAVATRFCEPEFTITELRRVYEVIWNTTLDAGNFQRKVRLNRSFREVGRAARDRRKQGAGRVALAAPRKPTRTAGAASTRAGRPLEPGARIENPIPAAARAPAEPRRPPSANDPDPASAIGPRSFAEAAAVLVASSGPDDVADAAAPSAVDSSPSGGSVPRWGAAAPPGATQDALAHSLVDPQPGDSGRRKAGQGGIEGPDRRASAAGPARNRRRQAAPSRLRLEEAAAPREPAGRKPRVGRPASLWRADGPSVLLNPSILRPAPGAARKR